MMSLLLLSSMQGLSGVEVPSMIAPVVEQYTDCLAIESNGMLASDQYEEIIDQVKRNCLSVRNSAGREADRILSMDKKYIDPSKRRDLIERIFHQREEKPLCSSFKSMVICGQMPFR